MCVRVYVKATKQLSNKFPMIKSSQSSILIVYVCFPIAGNYRELVSKQISWTFGIADVRDKMR